MTWKSYSFLGKWIIFAILASVFGIIITYSFVYLLMNFTKLLMLTGIPLYAFPICGAVICAFVIYKITPSSAGEGIPAYLIAVNNEKGKITLLSSVLKYFAVLFTLGFGGSGGVVGPMVRVNAGLMSFLGDLFIKLGFTEDDRRTFVICGASAVCAVVLQAPMGAGFFAVEILRRANMRYLDLFPSIITSSLCIAIVHYLGLKPIFPFHVKGDFHPTQNLIWIVLLGLVTGYYSIWYVSFYSWIRRVMGRDKLRFRNMALAALFVSFIAFIIDKNILSTSFAYFDSITLGEGVWPFEQYFTGRSLAIIFIFLAVLKGTTNCIIVGSGLSAGFTGPSIIMGLFLGAALAQLLGIDPSDGAYYAFLASGMSGVLSSSMNVPLAAAVLGAEIFGPTYGLPATISSIIAFQVARRVTLYDTQYGEMLDTPTTENLTTSD